MLSIDYGFLYRSAGKSCSKVVTFYNVAHGLMLPADLLAARYAQDAKSAKVLS